MDRSVSSRISRELPPTKDLPGEMLHEKEGSHEGRQQDVSIKNDWADPIDPDGDCKIDQDRRESKITIVVPGTPHLLSAELRAHERPAPPSRRAGGF